MTCWLQFNTAGKTISILDVFFKWLKNLPWALSKGTRWRGEVGLGMDIRDISFFNAYWPDAMSLFGAIKTGCDAEIKCVQKTARQKGMA